MEPAALVETKGFTLIGKTSGGPTLAAAISAILDLDPAAPFLHFNLETCSYDSVHDLGRHLEEILNRAGLARNQAVGIVARNRPSIIGAMVGLMANGRCLLPIPGLAPDAVLCAETSRSRPGVVVADPQEWSRPGFEAAVSSVGALGIVLPKSLPGLPTIQKGLEHIGKGPHCEVPADAAAALQTSGTTGPPKRVFLEGARLLGGIRALHVHHGASEAGAKLQLRTGVAALILPIDHMGPFGTLVQSVLEGRQIAILERFEPAAWADLIQRHKIKTCGLPPAAMRMVLDSQVEVEKLASLRAVRAGAAHLPVETAIEWEERYRIPILQAYGATEFAGGLASTTIEDRHKWGSAKLASVGRPFPGVELRIVDAETDQDLPVGRSGHLLVSRSLAGDPPGWVRTNDLAHLDEDGFLYIDGRADAVINRGGLKVDSREVEEALRNHPAVLDAAVVAVPDARLGQVPAAVVVRDDGHDELGAEELRSWLRGRLEVYKVPTQILFVDRLPLTTSGKIALKEVTALFV